MGSSGSMNGHPAPGVYNGIDTGFTQTDQPSNFSDFLKSNDFAKYAAQVANNQSRGLTYYKTRTGGYVAANTNDGFGGEKDSVDATGLMTDYASWQAAQNNQQTLWNKYADLTKEQPGMKQAVLAGPNSNPSILGGVR